MIFAQQKTPNFMNFYLFNICYVRTQNVFEIEIMFEKILNSFPGKLFIH